jgi:hypothetical protein
MAQRRFITSRSIGLSAIVASALMALAAIPALAATSTTIPTATSACSAPQLAQLLLPAGDTSWYTLMPGDAVDNFAGDGWRLSGGARIVTTALADGQTGSVLDLPGGSTAVSPTICVASSYPTGRMMIRDVTGAEGVSFAVSYVGTKTAAKPRNTGQAHGSHSDWTLSNPVNLKPGTVAGWQQAQFTLTAGGKAGDVQVYDLYVDPRSA